MSASESATPRLTTETDRILGRDRLTAVFLFLRPRLKRSDPLIPARNTALRAMRGPGPYDAGTPDLGFQPEIAGFVTPITATSQGVFYLPLMELPRLEAPHVSGFRELDQPGCHLSARRRLRTPVSRLGRLAAWRLSLAVWSGRGPGRGGQVDLAAVNHRRRNAPLFGRSAVVFGSANEIARLSESGGQEA